MSGFPVPGLSSQTFHPTYSSPPAHPNPDLGRGSFLSWLLSKYWTLKILAKSLQIARNMQVNLILCSNLWHMEKGLPAFSTSAS